MKFFFQLYENWLEMERKKETTWFSAEFLSQKEGHNLSGSLVVGCWNEIIHRIQILANESIFYQHFNVPVKAGIKVLVILKTNYAFLPSHPAVPHSNSHKKIEAIQQQFAYEKAKDKSKIKNSSRRHLLELKNVCSSSRPFKNTTLFSDVFWHNVKLHTIRNHFMMI